MQGALLSTSDWQMSGVVARTFLDRLLGVWRAPAGAAVLIPTRSVHTLGRRRAIRVVGLDAGMRVVEVALLSPNRFIALPAARMILELPVDAPVPARGEKVEVEF